MCLFPHCHRPGLVKSPVTSDWTTNSLLTDLLTSTLAPVSHSACSCQSSSRHLSWTVIRCLGPSLGAKCAWPCHSGPTTDLFHASLSPASFRNPPFQNALLHSALSATSYQFWPQLIFVIPLERPSLTLIKAARTLFLSWPFHTEHLPEKRCCVNSSRHSSRAPNSSLYFGGPTRVPHGRPVCQMPSVLVHRVLNK